MKFNHKKAAIEMSISTIVIIVIGVSMLILGMVLVRSIMCKSLGLTDQINSKVENELNQYFGEAAQEYVCIGSTLTGPVKMSANGQISNIICTFKPTEETTYNFTLVSAKSLIPSLKDTTLKTWIKEITPYASIPPGNTRPTSLVRINIPSDAPEGRIVITIHIEKSDGTLVGDEQLDYDISRVGLVQGAVC